MIIFLKIDILSYLSLTYYFDVLLKESRQKVSSQFTIESFLKQQSFRMFINSWTYFKTLSSQLVRVRHSFLIGGKQRIQWIFVPLFKEGSNELKSSRFKTSITNYNSNISKNYF